MSMTPSKDSAVKSEGSNDGAAIVAIPTGASRVLRLAPTEDAYGTGSGEPVDASEASDPPQEASIDDPSLNTVAPGKMPILRAIELIAGDWFGHQVDAPNGDTAGEGLSPEAAIAYASELGLDLVPLQVRLTQLHATDFPCLVVDHDGDCRVLVKRINRWAYFCRTLNRDVPVDRKHLESTYSGSVFIVRPMEEFHARSSNGSVDDEAAHQDERPVDSIIWFLISTMLRKRPGALVQLAVASIMSNFLLILVPIFSMAVYDRVIPHLAYETLWALTIGIIIALIADLALRHVKVKLIDSIASDISHRVQVRFYRRLVNGRMVAMPRTGGALAQTIRDLEGYSQLIPVAFLSVFVDVPFICVTSIILAIVAGTVALVPLAGALAVAAVFSVAHLAS